LTSPFGSSRYRPDKVNDQVQAYICVFTHIPGGSNPAIRTLYYRLLRLLSASVQPLFVFDGPRKPTFKRNKRSGHNAGSLSNVLTKQMLKLFGFPFHIAPGEAEAECALLQREGIVDAVLSEDVDTLMFGCGLTLRNWSSEGSRGNHAPTHVSMYDAQVTREGQSGLDREGMILIAMMSGGDYITEGIPGCGIKLACQAARAGFGKSLCQLSRSDAAGLIAWRNNLSHEIQTNESRYFKTRHNALKIPDSFPNREVLGYYTHPVVSSTSKINKLKEDIVWDGEVDIPGLRVFVAETFEWVNKMGANKFIRGLAPALLVHKLRVRGDRRDSGFGDLILTAMNEMELVRAICGRRTHFTTDGTPELRVIYHPNDIVGLDLYAEDDDSEDYGRDGLAPVNDDDEIEAYASDPPPATLRSSSPSKRSASKYDPTEPEKLWVLETIAKVGIPLKVEDYEASLRDPKKFLAARAAAKRAAAKGGIKQGAMDKFVKVSKSNTGGSKSNLSKSTDRPLNGTGQLPLSPSRWTTAREKTVSSQLAPVSTTSTTDKTSRLTRSSTRTDAQNVVITPKIAKTKARRKPVTEKPDPTTNPWTLAQSSPNSRGNMATARTQSQSNKSSSPTTARHYDCIDLTSSTNVSPCDRRLAPPDTPRKHTHSTSDEYNTSLITPPKDGTFGSPSPRKKRSTKSPSKTTSPQLPRGGTLPLTPEPVSRRIDFQSAVSRARSSSPTHPSLEDIFLPARSDSKDCLEDAPSTKTRSATSQRQPSIPVDRTELEIMTITSSPPTIRSPAPTSLHRHARASLGEDPKPQPEKAATRKKYFVLRESLPGSWKEVDESMAGGTRSRAWRQSQVEILDMTED
jgi:Holliday junction resolvase YEN1